MSFPTGRGLEPQHLELVRQRHPAALRPLPRHAHPRTGITTPNRTSTGNHDATGIRTAACCRRTRRKRRTATGSRPLPARWCGSASRPLRRAASRPPPSTIRRTPTSRPSTAGSTTSSCRRPAAAVTDPELHGTGYTPLGRSLFYARMYFDNLVKPDRPEGDLPPERRHPGDRRRRDLRREHRARTTRSDHLDHDPPRPVHGRRKLQPVPPRRAGLPAASGPRGSGSSSSPTPTTGAANDTIAAAGGTGTAVRVSLTDANAAETAIVGIIAATVPPAEVCNGVDDNCNSADRRRRVEHVRGRQLNARRPTTLTGRHCAVESCNCVDDDCDGTVDEGFPPNACGQACGCAMPTERATAWTTTATATSTRASWSGRPASTPASAPAAAAASWSAAPTGWARSATRPPSTPQPEVCNNIDDNCNGQIDEGDRCPASASRCGNGLGTCQSGTFSLHERPPGVQRDGHARGRDLQRHRRQLRRRHRQRHLPADRPEPASARGSTQAKIERRGICRAGASSAAARPASCARAARCRAPRSATARTTTATA